MSENYLMLNGKRIDLTEEQVKTLTAEEKESPFARVKKDDKYFRIGADGGVHEDIEAEWKFDDGYYSIANYCTDKAMMEQRALHEILSRLLWRYSEEHGGDNEWDHNYKHWGIWKKSDETELGTYYCYHNMYCGVIFFKDEATAQSAIDEIVKPFIEQHPEFVW